MKKNLEISKEYVCDIGPCWVYGDKIVLHKSDLERAIKVIKCNPDPYEREYFRAGKIDAIEDMIRAIKKGMKNIRERYGSKVSK